MSVLIRRFKLRTGMMKEERIDEPDRIERYMQFFDKEGKAKLEAGQVPSCKKSKDYVIVCF